MDHQDRLRANPRMSRSALYLHCFGEDMADTIWSQVKRILECQRLPPMGNAVHKVGSKSL
jgi:hypothetical protein